jgi:hypothetical protein
MRRSRPMRAAVVQIASAARTMVNSQLPEYQAREILLALERAGATEIAVHMTPEELCLSTYSPETFKRAKRILGRIPALKRYYEVTYVDRDFEDELYCEVRYRLAA